MHQQQAIGLELGLVLRIPLVLGQQEDVLQSTQVAGGGGQVVLHVHNVALGGVQVNAQAS